MGICESAPLGNGSRRPRPARPLDLAAVGDADLEPDGEGTHSEGDCPRQGSRAPLAQARPGWRSWVATLGWWLPMRSLISRDRRYRGLGGVVVLPQLGQHAERALERGRLTVADICADLGISPRTFYEWRIERKGPAVHPTAEW